MAERDELVPAEATRAPGGAAGTGHAARSIRSGYHLLMRDLGRAAPIGDIIAWMLDAAAVRGRPSGAEARAAAGLGAGNPAFAAAVSRYGVARTRSSAG